MARKYATLLYKDRLIIQEMCKAGKSVSNIAKELGVHRDTIYKEFKRTNMTKGKMIDGNELRISLFQHFS